MMPENINVKFSLICCFLNFLEYRFCSSFYLGLYENDLHINFIELFDPMRELNRLIFFGKNFT